MLIHYNAFSTTSIPAATSGVLAASSVWLSTVICDGHQYRSQQHRTSTICWGRVLAPLFYSGRCCMPSSALVGGVSCCSVPFHGAWDALHVQKKHRSIHNLMFMSTRRSSVAGFMCWVMVQQSPPHWQAQAIESGPLQGFATPGFIYANTSASPKTCMRRGPAYNPHSPVAGGKD